MSKLHLWDLSKTEFNFLDGPDIKIFKQYFEYVLLPHTFPEIEMILS